MENIPREGHSLHRSRRQTIPLPLETHPRLRAQVLSLLCRKLKAQRLRWTTAWRRLHKKIKQSDQGKLKKKKVFKIERAFEGVTIEAIKKLKTAKPEDKKALAEEAIREIKERKKALIAKKTGDKKAVNKDKNIQQKAQDKAAQKVQKKAAGKPKK